MELWFAFDYQQDGCPQVQRFLTSLTSFQMIAHAFQRQREKALGGLRETNFQCVRVALEVIETSESAVKFGYYSGRVRFL